MVDHERLRLAAQLLAKAGSTDADSEAVALVERSYRLLAQVITLYDLEQGETSFGPRRRERRHLRDRRGADRGVAAIRGQAPEAAAGYRRISLASEAADRLVSRVL